MKRITWGLLGVLLLIAVPVRGGTSLEIDNLIIERTLTRIGHEFYRDFVTRWNEAPQPPGEYHITIVEKADPRWGSLVWIEVGTFFTRQDIVYRKVLSPRTIDIQKEAAQAIEAVRGYFQRVQEFRRNLQEDLAGTGVY
jgi:curli production assembly/transport component CsgE